jgi:hypothetical protein
MFQAGISDLVLGPFGERVRDRQRRGQPAWSTRFNRILVIVLVLVALVPTCLSPKSIRGRPRCFFLH